MATRIVGFGHDGQNFGQVDLGGRFSKIQRAGALNVGLARQDGPLQAVDLVEPLRGG